MKNNDRRFSQKPEKAPQQPQSILFESVEARVLFSAVPAEAPAGTDDRGDLAAETIQQEAPHLETAETSVPESGLENAISAAAAESATAGNTEVEDSILADFQESADETVAEGRELVFISANGFDHDYLAANLDPSYEVYLIPDGANGLDSIAQALNSSEGVSAIHLITHGEQGRLFLGSAVLDAESIIGEYRTQLAAIGQALPENADILVYGCDFASGVEGAYAAELLAAITGTEVAASTDGTGHASLDGDWDLETSTGEIEARTLAFDSWQGLLAPPSIAAPSAEIITLEDTAIVFSGGQAITVGSDAYSSLTLTLSVGQGSLTLSGAVGITFLSGTVNGGSTLEISGLITDLNAAINGMTFTPAQDIHGSETLSLLAYDGDEINSATIDLTIVSQNDAPVIDVTPVNAGATGTPSETVSHTFTLADFEAVDPDNSNNQLTFRIESLPVVGELRLSGFPVAIGSVFTQASLASGALVYIHNGGETHADTFSVTVNDGAGGASLVTAIPITITPVNDAMSVSTSVTVYEGGNTGDGPVGPGKPIPGLSLSISDAESDAKTVTITSLPGGGVLSYNGTPITQTAVNLGFTFASANFSLLSYQHDGVDDTPTGPSNRSFGIRVTDQGGGTGVPAIVNRTVTITVVSVNDEPDLVTLSTAVPTLESGESHVLGLSDIEATDPDGDDSQLTYTMVTAPSLGELYIGGQLAGVGATFTQAQLAAGVVVFTNPGVDGLDTVSFVVKDRQISILTDELGTLRVGNEYTAPRHLSLSFDLNSGPGGGGTLIKLTEGADLPIPGPGAGDTIELTSLPAEGEVRVNGIALGANVPVTLNPGDTVTYHHNGDHVDTDGFTWEINGTPSPVSVRLYLYNDSPLLLTTTLTGVFEGDTQPITTANLIATDEETTNPAQLVYTVIGSPAAGSILFDGNPLGAFGTFTHQDVIDGRLSYSHNGNEDFLDQIELELADGAATSTNTLSIEITPVNDQPRITASFMQLMEGEEKAFTAGALSVSDVDGVGADIPLAPDSPLQIRVDSLPAHGSLWYNHPTLGIQAVTAGFIFDANQVTRLSYEHDSSENFSDSFNFTAIDNNTYNNPGHDAPGTRAGVMNLGITPVNDAPAVTVNAGLIDDINGDRRVFEGGYRVLTTDVLLSADPDSTNEQVQYRITTATVNGTLLLNGTQMASGTAFTQNDLLAGRVRYLHNGSETTTDQFTFRIDDASSDVPAQVFLIGIKPVNDAPRISAPGSAVVNTADYAFTGSRTISISDSDAGGADVTATLTVTDPGGLLRVTTTTGLTSITGNDTSNVLSLTGSVAEINAALATLRYRATDLDGPATLTIHVNDAGNTGIDPHDVPPGEITGLVDTGTATDEQATRVVNLLVSPINDVPANTIPMDQTTYEDIAFTFSTANGNALAISDVDAFGQDVEVTLAVTNGTLSLGSVTGLTLVTGDGVSDATITFRGTPAEVNAALQGLRYLGNLNYNGPDTLTIITRDLANTGDGGSLVTSETIGITVLGVNDAPTIAGPSGTVTVSASTFAFSGPNTISIADLDAAPGLLTVTLTSNDPSGILELTQTAGLSAVSGNGTSNVLAFTGTITDLNAALASLTYSPGSDLDTGSTLTLLLSDNGNTGVDPSTLSLPATGTPTDEQASRVFNLQVSDLNDPPVNSVPGAQTFNEDTTRTFNVANGNVISISDPDAFGFTVTTTVSVNSGRIQAGGNAAQRAALSSLTGNNSTSMTLTGTIAQINAVLLGLRYTPNSNFNGTDTMTIVTNDLGNTGLGGPLSDSDQITLNVLPVNDAPVNTVPTARVTPEDTAIVFSSGNSNRISVADVDVAEGTNALTVTLDATEGTLTLFQLTGLTITTGTGTGDASMTFTGTAADINAALNGLTFAPRPDYHGPAQLRITTSDNGNFGSGGIRTDVDTIGITVTPVADTVDDHLTTDEDTPVTFNVLTGAGDAEADLFSDPARAISSHTEPSHGTIIVAANGEITYSPDQDWYGVDTFQYTVTAGGSTETATVTITVNAVNDPPVAIDDTFTVPEDGSVTIDVLDDDYDVENDPITITHVEGTAIAEGETVPVDNGSVRLVGGQLVFTPTPDYFGPASFEYTITDGEFSDTATVTGTVTPTPRALTIADVTRDEDQNLVFTVVLNKATSGPFTVDVSTLAGSATGGGVDFTDLAGHTLSFAGTKGESVTFTVLVNDDSLIENNENLTVSLGNISIADVNITDTAIGTIVDNDARLAPAGPGTGVTTDVELVSNGTGGFDLIIEDVETESVQGFSSEVTDADSTDRLHISRVGGDYIIRDTSGLWLGSPIIGATRGGVNEIRVPVAMVTGSIIIRTGIGDDTVTIGDLGASLAGDLVVNTEDSSGQFNDFDTITYGSATTLATGADAEFRADTITAQANARLTTAGDGTVTWIAGRNITMERGASVVTDTGDIRFEANLADVRTGSFAGIQLTAATLQSTSGDIDLDGRGGESDAYNDGVRLTIDRTTRAGSTLATGGAVTIDGTGGRAGSQANGVNITGSSVQGGSLAVNGTGGVAGGLARGIYLFDADLASTTGDLTIAGTGRGNGLTSSNYGVAAHSNTTLAAAGAGHLSLSGTGGAGVGGLNIGVYLADGTTASVVNGDLTLNGTGGTGGTSSTSQNRGAVLEKVTLRSSGAGDISIDGTGNGLGQKHLGVAIGKSTLSATGSGSIAVAGTGSATGSTLNHGLTISTTTIQTAGGDIGLTGIGGGTLRKNDGLEIDGKSVIAVTAGAGSLTIAGTAGSGDSDNVGAYVSDTRLSTVDGDLTIDGTGRGTLDRNRGVFTAKATLSTSGTGDIDIQGTGSTTSTGKSNEGVSLVNSTLRNTGSGNLTVQAQGGSGNGNNHGLLVSAGTLTSASGATSLTGSAHANTTGKGNTGITLAKASRVEGATLSLIGTGGRGTSNNFGLWMVGGTARATAGAATLTGQALSTTTGTGNFGVYIQNQVTLSATSTLGITGTGGGGTKQNHGIYLHGRITATGALTTGTQGSGSGSKATYGDYFKA